MSAATAPLPGGQRGFRVEITEVVTYHLTVTAGTPEAAEKAAMETLEGAEDPNRYFFTVADRQARILTERQLT